MRHHQRYVLTHPNGHEITAKCNYDDGPGAEEAHAAFMAALAAAGFRPSEEVRAEEAAKRDKAEASTQAKAKAKGKAKA